MVPLMTDVRVLQVNKFYAPFVGGEERRILSVSAASPQPISLARNPSSERLRS